MTGGGYTEQHLRKLDARGIPTDPPAILTDRTTYVNFLETQLERVSAACMSVSKYDQRFKDMEALIVRLEGRCTSSAKLATINQETILNVKGDLDRSIQKL